MRNSPYSALFLMGVGLVLPFVFYIGFSFIIPANYSSCGVGVDCEQQGIFSYWWDVQPSSGAPIFLFTVIPLFLASIFLIYFPYRVINKIRTGQKKLGSTQLSSTLIYYAHNARSSIFHAVIVSLFVFCLYLFFPNSLANPFYVTYEDLALRFSSGYGIYIGVFGTIIGLNLAYVSSAPITDITKLLNWLTADLDDSRTQDSLYYVFPAPDIGLFRAVRTYMSCEKGAHLRTNEIDLSGGFESGDGREFKDWLGAQSKDSYEFSVYNFITTFDKLIRSDANHFTAVIYQPSTIPDFYLAYAKQTMSGEKIEIKNAVKLWYKHTRSVLNYMKHHAQKDQSETFIYSVSPNELPQHLIIIGSVVYTIHTFGMPIFREGKFHINTKSWDSHTANRHNLAELIAYRRNDHLFADSLRMEINTIHGNLQVSEPDDIPDLNDLDWDNLYNKNFPNPSVDE